MTSDASDMFHKIETTLQDWKSWAHFYKRNDKIDILINQNPELQGYMAVQTIYKNHFFNYAIEPNNYFTIEIVTKENIDFLKKF